jgi:hypothetical protein
MDALQSWFDTTFAASDATSVRRRNSEEPHALSVLITRSRLVGQPANGPDSYREYRVEVSFGDASWAVWRRFSQFVELKAVLRSPEARAPLPPKGLLTRHAVSEEAVAARIPALNEWITAVAAGADAASPALLCFLGLATSLHGRGRAPLHVRSMLACEAGESGDIVLFRTRATVPALQRAVTRSRWDHVGVLLFRDGRRRVCRAADCASQYAATHHVASHPIPIPSPSCRIRPVVWDRSLSHRISPCPVPSILISSQVRRRGHPRVRLRGHALLPSALVRTRVAQALR